MDGLRAAGLKVEIHDGHFPQDSADEIWIGKCAQEGWVAITEDVWGRGRKDAAQLRAVAKGRAYIFRLATSKIPADEWAPTILRALPKILKVLKTRPGPVVAKITRSSDVVVQDGYFQHEKEKN